MRKPKVKGFTGELRGTGTGGTGPSRYVAPGACTGAGGTVCAEGGAVNVGTSGIYRYGNDV